MHSVASSDLTYDDYLKVSQLLSLQVTKSQPTHHDELLFIIIHQSYELWFKLVLHEMENAVRFMREDQVLRAHHFLNRIVQIMRLLVQQIHILETLSPVEFLQFREHLMPASGFQSTQFREIEFMAGLKNESFLKYFENFPECAKRLKKKLNEPDLREVYLDLLRSKGLRIPKNAMELLKIEEGEGYLSLIRGIQPIYQVPSENLELYLLSEALVEFDEYLGLWREHHVRVVERVIGARRGTGGSQGVEYLQSTTTKKCFPFLWDVRTLLTK